MRIQRPSLEIVSRYFVAFPKMTFLSLMSSIDENETARNLDLPRGEKSRDLKMTAFAELGVLPELGVKSMPGQ